MVTAHVFVGCCTSRIRQSDSWSYQPDPPRVEKDSTIHSDQLVFRTCSNKSQNKEEEEPTLQGETRRKWLRQS